MRSEIQPYPKYTVFAINEYKTGFINTYKVTFNEPLKPATNPNTSTFKRVMSCILF